MGVVPHVTAVSARTASAADLALSLLHCTVMSQHHVQRRAFPRAQLDGLARVVIGEEVLSFRIADVSHGGLGLRGDPGALPVGAQVRVMVTCAVGARLDTCPRLETWAVVRRAVDGSIGLVWAPSSIACAEQISYLVEDSLSLVRPN